METGYELVTSRTQKARAVGGGNFTFPLETLLPPRSSLTPSTDTLSGARSQKKPWLLS